MKLLAIPNDPTNDYRRSDKDDFLSEFNPLKKDSSRYFKEVRFLNCRDDSNKEYAGIRSHSFPKEKAEIYRLIQKMTKEEMPYDSAVFEPIFQENINEIEGEMKKYSPDMIRAFNTYFAAGLGKIVSEKLGIPLIISAHDPSRLTPAIKYADNLVCISQDLASKSIRNYGVDPKKITIIPDGIDMDGLFFPRGEKEYNSVIGKEYNGDPKILSVGRIVPSKNIEKLLQSIALIKKDFPNLKHFHLGNGTPDTISKIKILRNSLGLKGKSFFPGGIQKEQLPNYYSWADIYALPTKYEGLGRAQIEALSCGTPVITTNDAPMNTIVIDGKNGFTIDPENTTQIADKIVQLASNERLLKKMGGKNARESVKRFNIKTVMEQNCQNYDRIIKGK